MHQIRSNLKVLLLNIIFLKKKKQEPPCPLSLIQKYSKLSACIKREEIVTEGKKHPVELEHEKEWKLARTLLKLPDVLVKITEDLCLHSLCEYLFEVSFEIMFFL